MKLIDLKHTILSLTALLLLSCNSSDSDQREVVSVTIEPLRYFVEQIAGDEYNVNVIVPEDASPESYSLRASDMRRFERSKLFVSIGLLETEHNINERSKSTDIKLLELKNSVDLAESVCSHGDHSHTVSDPHIWTSVNEARIIAGLIKESLNEINPQNSDKYCANYNKLISSIDSLDCYIKDKFSQLTNRTFIIYHPSLTYFAREYALTQIGVEREGKESSIKDIKEVIDGGKDVKAIFYQSQFSQSSVNTICKELKIEPIAINPLSYDWLTNMYEISDKLYKALK